MDRERRKRTGRALPAAAAAANGVRAAADEIRATVREFRQYGVDISIYMKDGAPAIRIEIADNEIERGDSRKGANLLHSLVSLFGK